jgi:peptidyl-prolyl cis-trans isomerase D
MPSRDIRRAQKKKGEAVSEAIEKRHTTHPLIYAGTVVVLVIVVFAFVLVGPGGPLGRGGGAAPGTIVFGTYAGHDIAFYPGSYFAQQRDQLASQVRNSQNQNTRAVAQMVWYQAFMSTAAHVAILSQIETAGVNVSDGAIGKALARYPAFLDENGNYSEARVNATSAADQQAAIKTVKEDLLTKMYFSDIVNGPKRTPAETDVVKSMAVAERGFSFVSWLFDSFPADQVRAYAEANKAKFLHVKLSRITVKTSEAQATEIRKKIQDKTSTFEELAKTYSKDGYADKGGDMGWRYAYDIETEFENKDTAQKVLALKAGELSEVLKSIAGWEIYRCDSEAVSPDLASTPVLDDVKSYIGRFEKGKVEDYFNGLAAKLAARAAVVGFDKAAAEMGQKVATLDPFPVNLENVFSWAPIKATPDTATPLNAVYNEDFFVKAFSLAKDQVSAPVVLDDRILVMKLKEEKQLPEATASQLDGFIDYVARESLQGDLQAVLMTPDKFKNNFEAAFEQYVMPRTTRQ